MASRPLPPSDGSRPAWRDVEPALPPRSVLEAHGARVLDPQTAMRLPGEAIPRPTAYIADSLIVPIEVTFSTELTQLLDEAAGSLGMTLPGLHAPGTAAPGASPSQGAAADVSVGRRRGIPDARAVPIVPGRLPDGSLPTSAPDAWRLLQTLRGSAPNNSVRKALAGVGLDHLLFGCPHIEGHPVSGMAHIEGHPFGIDEYAYAGSGGRAPVTWVGRHPDRDMDFTGRRPVVAVLDTGCGQHTWLHDGVRIGLQHNGVEAGLTDPATDPEITGDIVGPMDGSLDSHSGHGTFIAGLIRQICPDADIIAIRVMSSDGVVHESDLIRAMNVVGDYVADGIDGQGRPPIDVVSLSLGYYHEQPPDELLDPVLLAQAQAMGSLGVAVVACAGNDGTAREMYPAAFAPHTGGEVATFSRDCIPVLSIGALNPDGSVALFSNGGAWVLAYEEGAAVVSTFPQTFNGGAQPSVEVGTPLGVPRATIDPDSFVGGFGTWSGTSFSTPILAAKLARNLLHQERSAQPATIGDPLARMWDAVTAEIHVERPAT